MRWEAHLLLVRHPRATVKGDTDREYVAVMHTERPQPERRAHVCGHEAAAERKRLVRVELLLQRQPRQHALKLRLHPRHARPAAEELQAELVRAREVVA